MYFFCSTSEEEEEPAMAWLTSFLPWALASPPCIVYFQGKFHVKNQLLMVDVKIVLGHQRCTMFPFFPSIPWSWPCRPLWLEPFKIFVTHPILWKLSSQSDNETSQVIFRINNSRYENETSQAIFRINNI